MKFGGHSSAHLIWAVVTGWPEKSNYLLSGPLQKTFAGLCFGANSSPPQWLFTWRPHCSFHPRDFASLNVSARTLVSKWLNMWSKLCDGFWNGWIQGLSGIVKIIFHSLHPLAPLPLCWLQSPMTVSATEGHNMTPQCLSFLANV